MADLSGPIRKLESRARHHRAVAGLDREYAAMAGDLSEAAEWKQSADDHDATASNYEVAVRILSDYQLGDGDVEA